MSRFINSTTRRLARRGSAIVGVTLAASIALAAAANACTPKPAPSHTHQHTAPVQPVATPTKDHTPAGGPVTGSPSSVPTSGSPSPAPTCVNASSAVLNETFDQVTGQGTVTLKGSLPLCKGLYYRGASYSYDTPPNKWPQHSTGTEGDFIILAPGSYHFVVPASPKGSCKQGDGYAQFGSYPVVPSILTGSGANNEPSFLSDFASGPATWTFDANCVAKPVTPVTPPVVVVTPPVAPVTPPVVIVTPPVVPVGTLEVTETSSVSCTSHLITVTFKNLSLVQSATVRYGTVTMNGTAVQLTSVTVAINATLTVTANLGSGITTVTADYAYAGSSAAAKPLPDMTYNAATVCPTPVLVAKITPTGSLAMTGSHTGQLIGLAVALLLAGSLLTLFGKRPRRNGDINTADTV